MSDPLSFARLLGQLDPVATKLYVRPNPRPAGVIRGGSASEIVLGLLRSREGFWTEAQLMLATRRSHSAISWALLYLVKNGLAEARPDWARNSRYKKYRATRSSE